MGTLESTLSRPQGLRQQEGPASSQALHSLRPDCEEGEAMEAERRWARLGTVPRGRET